MRTRGLNSHLICDPLHHTGPFPVNGATLISVVESIQPGDVAVLQKITGPNAAELAARLSDRGVKLVYIDCDYPIKGDVAKQADSIVCSSRFLADCYRREGHESVTYIPDAPESFIEPRPDSRSTRLRCLWFGRADTDSKWKPVERLTRLMQRGPQEHWTFHTLSNHPKAEFRWRGLPWKFISRFDAVVIPYRDTETRARAKSANRAVQSMALGVPVIASPIPAYDELITDGQSGFLCRDDDEWIAALDELRDPTLRYRIKRQGYDLARDRFSPAEIMSLWCSLFQSHSPVLGQRRDPTARCQYRAARGLVHRVLAREERAKDLRWQYSWKSLREQMKPRRIIPQDTGLSSRQAKVTFFITQESELEARLDLDPDRDWQRMRRKQRWVLQTYLRLARAGYPVEISRRVPDTGIVVFHSSHELDLRLALDGRHRDLVLVAIRGDKWESYLADFEVVQNGRWADGRRRNFIPYWPQPGLIPRDPTRAARVECVAFKGFDVNLHPYFAGAEWLAGLRDAGIEWACHSMDHRPSEETGVRVAWHDYSGVDITVAFRPAPSGRKKDPFTSKPATKLYNSWHAGVPAILGREYAYRELRRSELDYIEIERPEEALEAISRLRADPVRYRAMVGNGLQRASQFTCESILDRWADLLFERIPSDMARLRIQPVRRLPFEGRRSVRRMGRRVARRAKR